MVHTHGVEGSTPPLATNLAEASDFSEAFFVVENFVEKGYDFIWFCKDIERVYLGKKVDDSQKKRESATFKAKKLIEAVEECKLVANNYRANTSNIMLVIGKYLSRK